VIAMATAQWPTTVDVGRLDCHESSAGDCLIPADADDLGNRRKSDERPCFGVTARVPGLDLVPRVAGRGKRARTPAGIRR
jgi:hypothetical protein